MKRLIKLYGPSNLVQKYNREVDRESAYELLNAKLEDAAHEKHQEEIKRQVDQAGYGRSTYGKEEKSTFEKVITSPATRQIGNTIAKRIDERVAWGDGCQTYVKTIKSKQQWMVLRDYRNQITC